MKFPFSKEKAWIEVKFTPCFFISIKDHPPISTNIALRDASVNVHVMSKESADRITQRSLEELEVASKKAF